MKNRIKYLILFFLCFLAFNLVAEETAIDPRVQQAMSNPDYLVTAGDVYSLNYAAGIEAVSYKISVDSTYKIRVANLAVLDVRGKTFVELKKEVESIVTKNYPMSGVQFVLLCPANFSVVVTGEVKKTVEQSVWSLTRLSSVISGLGTNYASSRYVILKRANGTEKKCDLFLANRFGDFSHNPYLRPGDVIEIPRIEKRVTISGEVERPGTYELSENENLYDLITYYANGITSYSDLSKIEVTKVPSKQNINGEKIYLNIDSLSVLEKEDYILDNFDTVIISSYKNAMPFVFVQGAIQGTTSKVAIQYQPGEVYSNFSKKNKNLFTPSSDIENAYIIRKDQIIPVNLNAMIYGTEEFTDVVVEESDILSIPSKQFYVNVLGAVNKPGRYAYVPNRDYNYYVGLAGGFNIEVNSSEKVIIKNMYGETQNEKGEILPEYTITAKSNSFIYNFNKYAAVISTLLAIITAAFTVGNYFIP